MSLNETSKVTFEVTLSNTSGELPDDDHLSVRLKQALEYEFYFDDNLDVLAVQVTGRTGEL
jgi:hypothetical protein